MKAELMKYIQIMKNDPELMNLIKKNNSKLYEVIMKQNKTNETYSEEERQSILKEIKSIFEE